MKLMWPSGSWAKPWGTSVFVMLAACVGAASAATSYPAHYGNSPISFDAIAEPSDTFVVSDRTSYNLDYYKYRTDSFSYDITVSIPISRYVGDVQKLLQSNLISKTFRLYIPAYDVDANSHPVIDCDGDGTPEQLNPEVDEVYFNDELIGTLSGDNNLWKFNAEFELDISKLKFPSAPGEVAYNNVTFRIDTANKNVPLSGGGTGCKVWATAIDWVGVRFKATSPALLLAGLSGSPSNLEGSGYRENLLNTTGLPSEVVGHSAVTPALSSCTNAVPSYVSHVQELRESAKNLAESWGTDALHLIAHSMAGIDARAFLADIASNPLRVRVGYMDGKPIVTDLKIPSLTTHASPHAGSVIADYVAAQIPLGMLVASDVCDLTTHTMQVYNQILSAPADTKMLLLGANADGNSDWTLDAGEVAGAQIPWIGPSNWTYGVLRDYDEAHLVLNLSNPFWPTFEVAYTPAPAPKPNDVFVTVGSALAAPGATGTRRFDGINHGTVIGNQVQNTVIDQGLNGVLDWRHK